MLKTVTYTKSQHIISDLKQHTNFFHDKKSVSDDERHTLCRI